MQRRRPNLQSVNTAVLAALFLCWLHVAFAQDLAPRAYTVTPIHSNVPPTVIHLNVLVALIAALLVGYTIGLAGQRNLFSVCLLAAAITITLIVIIDLDRSREGLITVTQQPLIDLEQELSSH